MYVIGMADSEWAVIYIRVVQPVNFGLLDCHHKTVVGKRRLSIFGANEAPRINMFRRNQKLSCNYGHLLDFSFWCTNLHIVQSDEEICINDQVE